MPPGGGETPTGPRRRVRRSADPTAEGSCDGFAEDRPNDPCEAGVQARARARRDLASPRWSNQPPPAEPVVGGRPREGAFGLVEVRLTLILITLVPPSCSRMYRRLRPFRTDGARAGVSSRLRRSIARDRPRARSSFRLAPRGAFSPPGCFAGATGPLSSQEVPRKDVGRIPTSLFPRRGRGQTLSNREGSVRAGRYPMACDGSFTRLGAGGGPGGAAARICRTAVDPGPEDQMRAVAEPQE